MANSKPKPGQHEKPCNECPFRTKSPAGYLGGNDPQVFARAAYADLATAMPCHLTLGAGKSKKQCAGRAIMWANSSKISRYGEVINLPRSEAVFGHISQFVEHHGITITPLQIMGFDPLDGEA